MALQGHSPPPPFAGPGSPPRLMNGYMDSQTSHPIYGPHPRSMLPPSPQHFPPPRYSQTPQTGPALSNITQNESRIPPPSHKRPGSSMSISSMLGVEPEKAASEQYPITTSRNSSRHPSISGPSMSVGAVMSPPQYSSKPNGQEYAYKPRSHSPDRLGGALPAVRPHRSSSGSMLQRPSPINELFGLASSKAHGPKYGDQMQQPQFGLPSSTLNDQEERVRRTSISGILQRPESQPQANSTVNTLPPTSHPFARAESAAPLLQNGDRFSQPITNGPEASRPNGLSHSYDTRPPMMTAQSRPQFPSSNTNRDMHPTIERSLSQSASPELRRQQLNATESRGLAGLLNQSSDGGLNSHSMIRQDSLQSQSERSAFGDRPRFRPFSPFAGSVASLNQSVTSVPIEEPTRKGSEELSQHRAILGLGLESKRGRYSPLPQAVQGAQAQTPVPDAGIKNEHGRVFSGIGSGMGSTSAAATPTPGALPASPFKKEDGTHRLSEENLMKMSRSTSGFGKRARKAQDDDPRADSEIDDGRRASNGRIGKRSKYGPSYKVDLEENPNNIPRRSTPLGSMGPIRRTSTPTNAGSSSQSLLHHQVQGQTSAGNHVLTMKPKKTIRLSSVIAVAKRNPRRHLGSFKYDPKVSEVDLSRSSEQRFDVSIQPNLLPSFTGPEQINCTYTVRVPKLWLQRKERSLICQEACLWGSGIYTDDSDPVAAAMHSGFLEAIGPEGIDPSTMEKFVTERNPHIEGLTGVPVQPLEPEEGKDAIITLVVMPLLEKYAGSTIHGVASRSWPSEEVSDKERSRTTHDGVSYMVSKVEFVSGAVEARRVGRTGRERRERLRKELEDRKRSFTIEKTKIDTAKKKLQEQKKLPVARKQLKDSSAFTTKDASPLIQSTAVAAA